MEKCIDDLNFHENTMEAVRNKIIWCLIMCNTCYLMGVPSRASVLLKGSFQKETSVLQFKYGIKDCRSFVETTFLRTELKK